ncbi:MAG: tRNA preQ1(34) S-adenosylmethionine ribosyltransferase-isomerase QueA [Oscillospiraceae bacterium]|nr:tRNA preQ1(34) S-adenosylmethionine ribosyltransferase-isomerase QueA [Oscillospiraceae bacterium]
MKRNDFWYELPNELIAQEPIERREDSRLLLLDRSTGGIKHSRFFELPRYLHGGDCLVLNDSRVIPARLLGAKDSGGAVEIVLLRDMGDKVWECLARPGRRIKDGARVIFGDGELSATVLGTVSGGNRLLRFEYSGAFLEVLDRLGTMPLPPYIHRELEDSERYQTVYSKVNGSAAAPTAGLHFSLELLDEINAMGVELCYITLHVGLGTFRPVKEDVVEDHLMHSEYFTISKETAEIVNHTKERGGRVIAVGTTSCRALEACAESDKPDRIGAFSGFTDIFIYPGYEFRCIDGLITNFHLPESTLIMLVSAFAGRERVLMAYEEAIRERYRFYSFGDAMFII